MATENKLMKKHTCKVCGKKFKTNRVDAKTCSPKCRQAAYRERVGSTVVKQPNVKPKAAPLTVKAKYVRFELTGEKALKYVAAINTVSKNSGVPRAEIETHIMDFDEVFAILKYPPEKQKKIVISAIKDKNTIAIANLRLDREERNQRS